MNKVHRNEMGFEFRFNDPVQVTLVFLPQEETIGHLVQVRKRRGQFGSDIYLVRKPNGRLQAFENVGLQPYAGTLPPVDKDDSEVVKYSIGNNFPEVGFLIE